MLNHTYTSIHGDSTLDCGKHCHTTRTKQPLLKENFLSEYKSELEKKKVLANLGITLNMSLEWCDVE